MTTTTAQPVTIEDLVDSFLERRRNGEQPSIESYVARHPELAAEIRCVLPAAELLENLAPESRSGVTLGPAFSTPAETIPQQLGEYRIVREIGRGGMGIVYEAVQETLSRQVALKVLPPQATLHPQYLERFRREAQAAARLHHANIVPVFGVGEHRGIHFIAMQYIAGQPLDAVLKELQRLRNEPEIMVGPTTVPQDSRLAQYLLTGRFQVKPVSPADPLARTPSLGSQPTRPDTSAAPSVTATSSLSKGDYFRRLAELGAQVADALGYAHQHGVIHRDIKPSNLLLDDGGVIWVTDFGLAKAVGTDELTHTGDIMGTLRYMAPEQLSGTADIRSDVYSLGITLYEMATLTPAFADPIKARLLDRVKGDEPTQPRKLEPSLPLDLETIILKAIAKPPEQRYATAAAFAADLRRFLGDRPIEARRERLWETSWRWCRRNPVVAGLGLLLLLSMVVGTTVSLVLAFQARVKQQEALAARKSAEDDLGRLIDVVQGLLVETGEVKLRNTPLMEPVREKLLEQALAVYRQLLADRKEYPRLRQKMVQTALWTARIQILLRHYEEAATSADLAEELARDLTEREPEDSRNHYYLATAHHYKGVTQHQRDRYAEAVIELERGLGAVQVALQRDEKSLEAKLVQADLRLTLGRVRYSQLRHDDAKAELQLALTELDKLREQHPGSGEVIEALSQGHQVRAFIASDLGDLDAAADDLQAALKHADRLLLLSPRSTTARHDQVLAQRDLAEVKFLADDKAEALKLLTHAETEAQRLCASYPFTANLRVTLASVRLCLGEIYRETGDLAKANEILKAGLVDLESIEPKLRNSREHPHYQARLRLSWGASLLRQGQAKAAAKELQPAVPLLETLAEQHPQDQRLPQDLSKVQELLARAQLQLGQPSLALAHCEKSSQALEAALRQNPRSWKSLEDLCGLQVTWRDIFRALKDPEAELAVYPRLIARLEQRLAEEEASGKLVPRTHWFLANRLGAAHHNHAGSLMVNKDPEAAVRHVEMALDWQRRALTIAPTEYLVLRYLRNHFAFKAVLLRDLGNAAEADRAQEEAIRTFSQLQADQPHCADAHRHLGLVWLDRAVALDKLKQWPAALLASQQAVASLGKAAQQAPRQMDCQLEWRSAQRLLGRLLVRVKRHAEVAALILNLPPREANECIVWAGILSDCIKVVQEDAGLETAERDRLTKEYGDLVMALLEEGAKKGYDRPDLLRKSKSLEPIKGRLGFPEVLRRVEENAKAKPLPAAEATPAGENPP